MNILNFAHPLPQATRDAISAAVGSPIEQVIDLSLQFDTQQAFAPQVVALIEQAGITSERFQTETWLVALPSLNYIAALVLAELHGRMGHFPAIIRLRPAANSPVTTYEFAEVIDLEQLRQHARTRR